MYLNYLNNNKKKEHKIKFVDLNRFMMRNS